MSNSQINDTSEIKTRVESALSALSKGKVIIVVDDYARENEGDLVAIAEKTTPETINFMATHGRGLVCQPITAEKAKHIDLPLMVSDQTDTHNTAFTVSVDHKSSTTGISAYERAQTVKTLAAADAQANDFVKPGHIFPLIARDGGVFERKGHTEAAADLARLSGNTPSGVICEIMKDNGTMARLPDLEVFAGKHGLQIISVEDIVQYRDAIGDASITMHSTSALPTEYGNFTIYTYTSSDPAVKEIIVLEKKAPDTRDETIPGLLGKHHKDTPVVRIHSECMTGEVFGSLRCDCGPQLQAALEKIGQDGGALVYLKQEGRGIGLIDKIRAYALQDNGADTVEANIELGHDADKRRFGAAAAVLRERGYSGIRLLTNNPEKEQAVKKAGIDVIKRETIIKGVCNENIKYLQTKHTKLGHFLEGVM